MSTLQELRKTARNFGLKGYSKLRKAELEKFINDHISNEQKRTDASTEYVPPADYPKFSIGKTYNGLTICRRLSPTAGGGTVWISFKWLPEGSKFPVYERRKVYFTERVKDKNGNPCEYFYAFGQSNKQRVFASQPDETAKMPENVISAFEVGTTYEGTTNGNLVPIVITARTKDTISAKYPLGDILETAPVDIKLVGGVECASCLMKTFYRIDICAAKKYPQNYSVPEQPEPSEPVRQKNIAPQQTSSPAPNYDGRLIDLHKLHGKSWFEAMRHNKIEIQTTLFKECLISMLLKISIACLRSLGDSFGCLYKYDKGSKIHLAELFAERFFRQKDNHSQSSTIHAVKHYSVPCIEGVQFFKAENRQFVFSFTD